MSDILIHRNSTVSGATPTTDQIELGEIQINTKDGKVFFAKSGTTKTVEQLISVNSTIDGNINFNGNVTANNFIGYLSGTSLNSDKLDGFNSTDFATVSGNTFNGNQNVVGNVTANNFIGYLSGTSLNSDKLDGFNSTDFATVSGNTFNGNQNVVGNVNISKNLTILPSNESIDTNINSNVINVKNDTGDLLFTKVKDGILDVVNLKWLEGNLYTGLLSGGLISATVSGTTFNISAGTGIVVTLNTGISKEFDTTIKYVKWNNITNIPLTYLNTHIQSFIAIDSNGNVVQSDVPYYNGQYNSLITIGTVIHQNLTFVNSSITYPNTAYGYKQRTYDFIKAFGPLKLNGLSIIPTNSLGLNVSPGTAWADGRNYQNDPNNPSYITDTGTTVSKIFKYYQSSGNTFIQDTNNNLGYTTIDPTVYNLNGVLTPVPGTGSNKKWSIQRVFWYPNSATKGIVVYYGNKYYNSSTDASANNQYEEFYEIENTKQNAIYLGAIVLRNDAVFTDSTSYLLLPAGIFRSVGGSGGGGGIIVSTKLQDLNDVAVGTIIDGDLLYYNHSLDKWVHGKSLTGNFNITGDLSVTGNITGIIPYSGLTNIPTTIVTGSTQIYLTGTTGFSTYIDQPLLTTSNVTFNNITSNKILIGTTIDNGYKLDVSGTTRTTGDSYFATVSGNVGIGTTSPSEKLNVTGNILASGTILGNNLSGTNTGDNAINSLYSGLTTSKQDLLNGTGFVKANGTTISYDNNTYLTTSNASSTYAPIASPSLTGDITISPTGSLNINADASSTEYQRFKWYIYNPIGEIGVGANSKLVLQTTRRSGSISISNPIVIGERSIGINVDDLDNEPSKTLTVGGDIKLTGQFFVNTSLYNYDEGNILKVGSGGEIVGINLSTIYLPINNPTSTGIATLPTIANTLGGNFATTSGNIGIGTSSPNTTSILDITSTTKGFLPPRMTTIQKNAISSPATGLTVYDTDYNRLEVYNGSAWVSLGNVSWGSITGTLSGQTDLQNALNLKQNQINGTGFVKANGTTISYDNNTYLTTSSASSTYAPLASPSLTGDIIISPLGTININADASSTIYQRFKWYVYNPSGGTIGANSKLVLETTRRAGFTVSYNPIVINQGNVGINVSDLDTEPSKTLSVGGDIKLTGQFFVNTSVNSYTVGNVLSVASGGGIVGVNLSTTYAPINNPTFTGTVTAPTIANTLGGNFATTSGNVGIGTQSPLSKLHVNGFGTFTSGIVGVGGLTMYGDNTSPTGITLLTNGNLGIATASPTEKLDIVGNIKITGGLRTGAFIETPTNTDFTHNAYYSGGWKYRTNGYAMDTYQDSSGNYQIYMANSGSTNSAITFNPRFTVTNTGNVGIGTTAPIHPLHIFEPVNNITSIALEQSTINMWRIGMAANSPHLRFSSTTDDLSSSLFTILQGGNVGIGTTTPAFGGTSSTSIRKYLSIKGDTDIGAIQLATGASDGDNITIGNLEFIDLNQTGADKRVGWISMAQSGTIAGNRGTYLRFATKLDGGSISEQLRIIGNGNVGIGTTAPVYKLEVNGTLGTPCLWTTSGGITQWGNGGTAYGILTWDTGYARINATSGNRLDLGGGGGLHMTIATSGNVGIGTTAPNRKLEVGGTEAIVALRVNTENVGVSAVNYSQIELSDNSSVRSYWRNLRDGSGATLFSYNNNLRFLELETERIRITSGGNVGIGTTNPLTKLMVAGDLMVGATNKIGFNYSISDSNFYNFIEWQTGSSGALNISGGSWTSTATQEAIRFSTQQGVKMSILNNGNVGIGTTTPRGKLDVTTTFVAVGTANDSIVFGSGTITYPTAPYGGYGGLVLKGLTSDARLMMQDGNGRINNYWNAYSDAGGYKYIVSSEPAARELIHINTNGYWSFYGAPSGTSGSSITFTQGAYIEPNLSVWFSPRGTSSDFYINNSGNVGIGTSSPLSTFNVAGTSALNWVSAGNSTALATIGTGGTTGGSLWINTASLNTSYHSGLGINGTYSNPGGVGTSIVNIGAYGVNSGGGYGSALAFITTVGVTATERMRIFSNGNVGIGTQTDNGYILNVNGSSYIGGGIITTGSWYMNNGQIIYAKDTSGTYQTLLYGRWTNDATYLDGGTGGLYLRTNNGSVNPMYMNASGNVGIGTTAPASKLHVKGNLIIGDPTSTVADNVIRFYNSSGTVGLNGALSCSNGNVHLDSGAGAFPLYINYYSGTGGVIFGNGASGGSGASVNASGQVTSTFLYSYQSITTATPLLRLETTGTGGRPYMDFRAEGSDLGYVGWGGTSSGVMYMMNYLNSDIQLGTNSLVRMAIKGNGNIGIGTTAPNSRLQISGAAITTAPTLGASTGGALYVTNTDTAYGLLIGVSGSGSPWLQGQRTDASATAYSLNLQPSGGNVLIGTSTDSGNRLNVNGSINFQSFISLNGVSVIYNTANDVYANIRVLGNLSTTLQDGMYVNYNSTGGVLAHLRFFANGTNERMRIDASTGNVYIGAGNQGLPRLTVYGSGGYSSGVAVGIQSVSEWASSSLTSVGSLYDSYFSLGGTSTVPTISGYQANSGVVASGATLSNFVAFNSTQWPSGTVTNNYGFRASGASGTNNYGVYIDNAKSYFGGNVGIGTSGPSMPLSFADSTGNKIALYSNYGLGINNSLLAIFANTSNDRVGIGYGGSVAGFVETLTVKGANVGIGTTSPASRLTVSGGSLATTGNGLHFASELTNGRTGTYDASSVSSIHTFFDAKTVELTTGSSSGYVTGISATGVGATLFSGALRFITSSAERMRIFANGNIAIGTTTDSSYKLDVTGTLRTTSNHINQGYLKVTNGIISGDNSRIFAPQGASYVTTTATITGAWKIKLPVAKFNSNTMLRMTIKIYTYDIGKSYTFDVGGYNFNSTWYNTFATSSTDSGTLLNVRFGIDATSNCIWIGELATTWSHPQVYVTDFQGGYVGFDEAWSNGWAITPVTAFDTVTNTRTSALGLNSTNNAFAYNLNQNLRTTDSPTFSTVTASLVGAGATYIQSTTVGTSYGAHYQIREKSGGSSLTTFTYAPALGFHWSGVVASSIAMESSGRIAIMNNPGTAYENFIAQNIHFTNYLFGNGKQAFDTTDSYLRLNQTNGFTSGIYTPYNFRADGTIYVGGVTYYIGSSTSNLNALTLNGVTNSSQPANYYLNGATNDPYGGISVTNPTTSSYSYYGLTRQGNIGMGMGITTSNQFFIGSTTAGGASSVLNTAWMTLTSSLATFTGSITESSSIRYKEDIKDLTYSLDDILKLRGVTYKKKGTSHVEIGVIAEEVNNVIPELVTKNQDGSVESVSYGRLSAIFIEAFKQQQEQIELLKQEINLLKQ